MAKRNYFIFALVFILASDLAQPAFAYLDPGTGSMILQLVLGGVAGFLVIGKLYWQRVKDFFGGKSSKPSSSSENEK